MRNRHSVRVAFLALVVALPLLGMSGVASAKAAKGCHKTHTCKSGGGSPTGSGTGADPAPMTVTASPNPLVETGQSEVYAVLQVETSPSFAGDLVDISSTQLQASCHGTIYFTSVATGLGIQDVVPDHISVFLDDDGNATVTVGGIDCAPGSSVIEADLVDAPYDTALTTLVANPPVVTPAGVTGYPNPEVETGDTTAGPNGPSGDSDVYAVFEVETSPVYAEQTVEIDSSQLDARCGKGWSWYPGNAAGGVLTLADDVTYLNPVPEVHTTLDDDGNATFIFTGLSCAAGDSQVIADVEAGTHPTYTTTYTVSPPAPTI